MSLPIPSFGALGPTLNNSALDQQFAALAAASVIACTASGSNAVALTPMANYFVPSAYTDAAPVFTWKQTQNSTGAVTINVANIGAVNAYKNNGQTAVGSTDLIAGAVYTAAYLGALNSGSGGFIVDVIPTALQTAWSSYTPTFSSNTGSFTSASTSGRFTQFTQLGKTVQFEAQIVITLNGTAGGWVNIGLPIFSGPSAGVTIVAGRNLTTGKALTGTIVAVSNSCIVVVYDTSYPGADGTTLTISGAYETV